MTTNDQNSTTAVESWLASLGLRATEVERCPEPACSICAHRHATTRAA